MIKVYKNHKIQDRGYYLWEEGEGKKPSGRVTIWNVLFLQRLLLLLYFKPNTYNMDAIYINIKYPLFLYVIHFIIKIRGEDARKTRKE